MSGVDGTQLTAYVTGRLNDKPDRRTLGLSALILLGIAIALALLLPGPQHRVRAT